MQCYSQRIYIQHSNWFIFDHFGHYFPIIFNLYSYCTKFNSIHINYNILSILLTNFNLLYLTSAKLFTKNLYTAIKLVHFYIHTILDTISECKVIHKDYLHFGHYLYCLQFIVPNSIRYTLTTIYYPSYQPISICYNSRVQCYSQRIYIEQSNWFIFDHFGHYFRIIFNLYSYCTKFNSILINYKILSILSTNFRLLYKFNIKLFAH